VKRHALATLITLCFSGASLFAQTLWPLPSKTQTPGSGYPDPMKSFVGRFLDSHATADYQVGFRTARAGDASISSNMFRYDRDHNRLYMQVGSAVFAYNADTFFSRLNGGEALTSVANVGVTAAVSRFGATFESIFPHDSFFYAENAPGWLCAGQDGQDRLFGYDVDDRGYLYMAYSVFGWGIAKDDYKTGGAPLTPVYQWLPSPSSPTDLVPTGDVIPVKTSAGSYYAIVSQRNMTSTSEVYDVSDPTQPTRRPSLARSYISHAVARDSGKVGLVGADGRFYVYTPDALVNGGAPLFSTGSVSYVSVDTDGTNFYATTLMPGTTVLAGLATITPEGASYRETLTPTNLRYGLAPHGRFGAGYFIVTGSEPNNAYSMHIYKVANGTFSELSTNYYFSRYYSSLGSDFSHYSSAYSSLAEGLVIRSGGRNNLLVAAKGLGDVYGLSGSAATNDFNGDGRSDILLRNETSGYVAQWLMNGRTLDQGAVVGTPDPSFRVRTSGDYDGDGRADTVLQNANGDVALWLMGGNAIRTGALIATPGSNWRPVASGDLNGDGRSDIILQNQASGDIAVWLMNGFKVTGKVISSPGTAWELFGSGDFDGDGKFDLLLQNRTSGEVAEWKMNGFTMSAGAVISAPGTAWKVKATGDFDADGKSDILLRNEVSGEIAEWKMDGFSIASGAVISAPGLQYDVVGTGEYNGDGRDDILLRNTNDGTIAQWLMNGMQISSGALIADPGISWVPVIH
jgi:hypothetical protein